MSAITSKDGDPEVERGFTEWTGMAGGVAGIILVILSAHAFFWCFVVERVCSAARTGLLRSAVAGSLVS